MLHHSVVWKFVLLSRSCWEGALNISCILHLVLAMGCRRNLFAFPKRSSLHPVLLIYLLSLKSNILLLLITFIAADCIGWWRGYTPWLASVCPADVTELIQDRSLCKGDSSGSCFLNAVCCLRGHIFREGGRVAKSLLPQVCLWQCRGGAADGEVWAGSCWRLPGASAGGSFSFVSDNLHVYVCVFFSSFYFLFMGIYWEEADLKAP